MQKNTIPFDLKQHLSFLNTEIENGYIKEEWHSSGQFRILNYTQKTQFEWRWNEITCQCRGLIVDSEFNLIARPFPKFFSYEQLEGKIPHEPFKAYEKLDGSLGILYWHNKQKAIATRGSFTSPQAVKATEILKERYNDILFCPEFTYLFEIIYPENKIVIDYGEKEDLILLAVIETSTGKEMPLPSMGMSIAKHYNGITDFNEILNFQDKDREGFVVLFESGQRVKIKFDDYKRLHKLLTGVSSKKIWEIISNGNNLVEYLENVPDEFYQWVSDIVARLDKEYLEIECRAIHQMRDFSSRKEMAEYFKTCDYPSVMFSMFDRKEHSRIIWKMLKPKGQQVFRCESISSN
jgi:RNA ligase